MITPNLRHTAAALLLVLTPCAPAASAPRPAASTNRAPLTAAALDKSLAGHKTRAAKHAANKHWDEAIRELETAKKEVQAALRSARIDAGPQQDPAYRREAKQLQDWLRGQQQLVQDHRAQMPQVIREFEAKRAALNKTYGITPSTGAQAAAKVKAKRARYGLMTASLDELEAGYFAGKGDKGGAASLREQTLQIRLDAYRDLGKLPEATQAAEKLLTVAPDSPYAFQSAGGFFQEQKQFSHAADVWQRGIKLVESGKAQMHAMPTPAGRKSQESRMLEQFYRQLGFCYYKLGKKPESQAAIQKANALGASVAPRRRR